jgi:hypothetical protein
MQIGKHVGETWARLEGVKQDLYLVPMLRLVEDACCRNSRRRGHPEVLVTQKPCDNEAFQVGVYVMGQDNFGVY